MAYDPTLATATDRVRAALGDTGSTSILVPGGETTYTALLTAFDDDEAAVYRAAAGMLANYYAMQVTSVSGGGESVSWIDRAAHWRAIAAGAIPYPYAPDGSGPAAAASGETLLTPVW